MHFIIYGKIVIKKGVFAMMKKKIFSIFMAAALCISAIVPCAESKAADTQEEIEAESLTPNLNYTFTSIDGTKVSTSAGSSKATILIFGRTTCGYTKRTVQGISESTWVKNPGIRTIFAEVNWATKEETESFAQSYGCPAITFCYEEDGSISEALWRYVNIASSSSRATIELPVVVLIDGENMIQKVMVRPDSEADIIAEINRFIETDNTDSSTNSSPNTSDTQPDAPKVGSSVTDTQTKSVCKVTSSGSSGCSVEYVKPSSKKCTSAKVPASVTVNGKAYAVTSIAPNAFKGNKKLKSVTIEKNIKKIGKNTFYGCKNLKKIVIRSKNLSKKSVGKNAFKGINSKAVIKAPKNKVKSYKTLFKTKGMSKKVKVKKL